MLDWSGVPLILHVASVARRALPELREIVIVGFRDDYEQLGMKVIADEYSNAGPLGGIATALANASTDRVFVLGCDLPLISEQLIRAMATHETSADVLVPGLHGDRSDQGGALTFETLHAIYSNACLPHIERAIHDGNLQTISYFDDVSVEVLSEEWVKQYDPMLESMMNVNRPEDLRRAQEIRTRRNGEER